MYNGNIINQEGNEVSRTIRNVVKGQFADDGRPEWQQNRGQRFGNKRRQEAALKVRERRAERAREKHGEAEYAML